MFNCTVYTDIDLNKEINKERLLRFGKMSRFIQSKKLIKTAVFRFLRVELKDPMSKQEGHGSCSVIDLRLLRLFIG